MSSLKPQEEKFVQGLMTGLSQRQAYLAAFPNSKSWKVSSVDSKASWLFKSDKVQERYGELLRESAEAGKVTRNSLVNKVKRIAFAPVDYDKVRPADQIRALELLAKLTGLDTGPDDD